MTKNKDKASKACGTITAAEIARSVGTDGIRVIVKVERKPERPLLDRISFDREAVEMPFGMLLPL